MTVAYDFAGNRIYKGGELSGTRYLIDTNNWISLVVAEIDTSTNKLSAYYTRGHELISLERDSKLYFYLFDGQGSTRKLINQVGTVTDTYNYDAFGKTTQKTGVTENEFLYNGEQYDGTTGLYYLRARYMDPSTGTFISMDVYQGSVFDPVSLHKYLYAHANPVMNEDPTGYYTLSDVMAATGIQDILDGIASLNFYKIFKGVQLMLKFINIANSLRNLYTALCSGDIVEIIMAMLDCIIAFIELADVCELQIVAQILTKVVALIGYTKHLNDLFDAIQDGDVGKIIGSSVAIVVDLITLFSSCFTGETLVYTEHGYKRIDEIEVGDLVWSYNVETGETELKEVLEVYEKETDEIVYVTTDDGETINTTSNHPFYVVDKGWVAAGDLEVDDVLYKFDGTETTIDKLETEKFDETVKVYNLSVSEFHSYFVSDDSVLVHNAGYKKDANSSNKKSKKSVFNSIKQKLGISKSQHPDSQQMVILLGENKEAIKIEINGEKKLVYSREWTYKVTGKNSADGLPIEKIVIQDHSYGHSYKTNVGNQPPHFNVRPDNNTLTGKVSGMDDHYYWD